MQLGFSYVGLIFLIMLFVPNLLWAKHKPKDYDKYAANENKALVLLERVGEVAVTVFVLTFSDFNWRTPSAWTVWLLLACLLMLLYEIFWVRYFRSAKTMQDFYSSLLGIPVAGATLPVMGFFCLSVYGKNIFLLVAVVVLAIGHIGIHWNHRTEITKGHKQGGN